MPRLALMLLLMSASWRSTSAWGEVPVEVQLAAQSLRSGEKAHVEKALGPLEKQPLYRVDLDFDPVKRTVRGQVSLTWTATRPTSELNLRLTPNAAHPGAVTLSNFELNGQKKAVALPDPSLVRVTFAEPLAAGQSVTLNFKLSARVPKLEVSPGGGLDLSEKPGDYGAFSVADDVATLSGIVPMVAPVTANGELMEGPSGIGDLGSFDPSIFVAGITVPQGWRAILPGVLSGEVPERDGRTRYTYAVVGARELPVIAAKGYEANTTTVGDVELEVWHAPANKKTGAEVLTVARESLSLLEQKLGPIPWKNLRVVETKLKGGAGGMEFPGLVTVSTNLFSGSTNPFAAMGLGNDPSERAALEALLGQAGGLGDELKNLMAATLDFTVCHELAHQYFAMMVGSDPVADPIADEPLTQHVALLLMEWRHGRKVADSVRDLQLKTGYQMMRSMGDHDDAASRPTWEFGSNLEYAALIYGKAPLLFDLWRKQLGDEAWLALLRRYVDTYRFRWVSSKTLGELAVKTGAPSSLLTLRKHWWEEKHGDEDIGVGGFDLAGAGASGGVSAEEMKALEELLNQALNGE